MKPVKRIGLKYCGGCNPSYERVEYVQRIQAAAGNRMEWVSIEEGDFDTLLIVNGCDKQCVLSEEYDKAGWRVLSLKDDGKGPEEILSMLLEEEEKR